MKLGIGQEIEMGDEINKSIGWLLKANVEELLEKALEENWPQSIFEKWLRIKEIQYLEKIAFRDNK